MVELIIGGSSSGKSEYAEKQILALPVRIPRYYVAAMAADDPESRARIRKHQLRRQNMNFITVEQPVDIENSLRQMCHGRKIILLECLTNLVANEMFGRLNPQTSDPAGIAEKICNGLSRLISPETDLFAVTDNVFEDGISTFMLRTGSAAYGESVTVWRTLWRNLKYFFHTQESPIFRNKERG